ncbi:hypothetical protein GLOTRDRAFT_118065, partial [Gloeophyllum trabeum ATCC 11539]
ATHHVTHNSVKYLLPLVNPHYPSQITDDVFLTNGNNNRARGRARERLPPLRNRAAYGGVHAAPARLDTARGRLDRALRRGEERAVCRAAGGEGAVEGPGFRVCEGDPRSDAEEGRDERAGTEDFAGPGGPF